MNSPISLFVALRYWRAKSADRFGRLVSSLASIGIVLGVMALIIVLSVMNGFEKYQKQQLLAELPHAMIYPKQPPISLQLSPPQAPEWVDKITAINSGAVIFQSNHGLNAGQLIGVQDFSDDPLLSELQGLSFDEFLGEGEFKLVVGAQLAYHLQLEVGDKVRVMLSENSRYTPLGAMPVQRLFRVTAIYGAGFDASNYTAFTNIADIGRLMGIPKGKIQGYRLHLTDPFLVNKLPLQFSLEDWNIKDWRSQKGEFFQAVQMEKNMMSLLIGLIILVAVANILTSLSLMVLDKQGEIAVFKTLGLNRCKIAKIFIWQGFMVGAIGSLLGFLLGTLISLNLNSIVHLFSSSMVFLPTEVDPKQLLIVLSASLLLSLISTLYPSYRASKINPADALRYE